MDGPGQALVAALSADRGRPRDRDRQHDADGDVFRRAAALCMGGQARRAARAAGVDAQSAPSGRTADEPVLMRILGISAHYHDSAAALLVDGVPVCAVQEERLSRHKNDATFPEGAIEWCLDHAGLQPADLDAVVFYERSLLKFERILTCTLRAFPRSWRSFPQAMKNSLGEKVWVRGIISSRLAGRRKKINSTRHHKPT